MGDWGKIRSAYLFCCPILNKGILLLNLIRPLSTCSVKALPPCVNAKIGLSVSKTETQILKTTKHEKRPEIVDDETLKAPIELDPCQNNTRVCRIMQLNSQNHRKPFTRNCENKPLRKMGATPAKRREQNGPRQHCRHSPSKRQEQWLFRFHFYVGWEMDLLR